MDLEIERKFLVHSDGWKALVTRTETLEQGYLAIAHNLSIRVRAADDIAAWLTIKHGGTALQRREFEYAIPASDAAEMLRLCSHAPIRKRRHHLGLPGGIWVIDEFEGQHAGLVLAEVELTDPDQNLPQPDWLGEEVTGDPRYYNAMLATGRADEES